MTAPGSKVHADFSSTRRPPLNETVPSRGLHYCVITLVTWQPIGDYPSDYWCYFWAAYFGLVSRVLMTPTNSTLPCIGIVLVYVYWKLLSLGQSLRSLMLKAVAYGKGVTPPPKSPNIRGFLLGQQAIFVFGGGKHFFRGDDDGC